MEEHNIIFQDMFGVDNKLSIEIPNKEFLEEKILEATSIAMKLGHYNSR